MSWADKVAANASPIWAGVRSSALAMSGSTIAAPHKPASTLLRSIALSCTKLQHPKPRRASSLDELCHRSKSRLRLTGEKTNADQPASIVGLFFRTVQVLPYRASGADHRIRPEST